MPLRKPQKNPRGGGGETPKTRGDPKDALLKHSKAVEYGARVRFQSEYTALTSPDRYLSVCKNTDQLVCGWATSLHSGKDSDENGNIGKFRTWIIGAIDASKTGSLRYGDVITIQGLATGSSDPKMGSSTVGRKNPTDLYLSGCGESAHGVPVTLRPDDQYTAGHHEREWAVEGGVTGSLVEYGKVVRLKGMNKFNPGHGDLYIAPSPVAFNDMDAQMCGVGITLRPDNSTENGQADWVIQVPPGPV